MLLVGLVLGQQQDLDAMLELRQAAVERFKFSLRQILHLGVGEHGCEVLTLGAGLPQLGDGLRDGGHSEYSFDILAKAWAST